MPVIIPVSNLRFFLWNFLLTLDPYHGRSSPVVSWPTSVLPYLSRFVIFSLLPSFWFALWRRFLPIHRKVFARQVERLLLSLPDRLLLHLPPSPHDLLPTLFLLSKSFSFLRHSQTIFNLITGYLSALVLGYLTWSQCFEHFNSCTDYSQHTAQ